jgi:hypothetical protein
VRLANEFIAVVASHGRKFFRHEDRVARFLLNDGHLYFLDAYSGRLIYTAGRRGPWRGFSNGGTLRTLVENLAVWIRHDTPLWMGFFEPLRDGGCRWGYGEPAMDAVREAAAKLIGGTGPTEGDPR